MCILQDLQGEGICIHLEARRSARVQGPSTWKHLRAPIRPVFKFIRLWVSHNVGSQNIHARWPSCVRNWRQWVETLRDLFDSFLAPVICSGKFESLLTSCTSLWERLGPPNAEVTNNFPSSHKVSKRRYEHEEFLHQILYWMQWRCCRRLRRWFVHLNRLNCFFF